jgi:Ca2+-binding RTX toxin-like protein
MQINGQSSLFYDFFGSQSTKEASISRSADGRITIDAGDGDDKISVKKAGPDQYVVNINGEEITLSAEEMKKLTIKGGKGDDMINIDASVDVGFRVDGGAGNDLILNRANGMELNGGRGDDTIVNLASNCTISGGSGNDTIVSHGEGNDLTGGKRKTKEDIFQLLFGQVDDAEEGGDLFDWIKDLSGGTDQDKVISD